MGQTVSFMVFNYNWAKTKTVMKMKYKKDSKYNWYQHASFRLGLMDTLLKHVHTQGKWYITVNRGGGHKVNLKKMFKIFAFYGHMVLCVWLFINVLLQSL